MEKTTVEIELTAKTISKLETIAKFNEMSADDVCQLIIDSYFKESKPEKKSRKVKAENNG